MKPFKKFKVLIVEDNKHHVDDLIRELEPSMFEVIDVVGSAPRAYEKVVSENPDILIVDLLLDEGDGLGLLVQLDEAKDDLPKLPYCIVVTSFDEGDVFNAAQEFSNFIYQKKDGEVPVGINLHLKGIARTLGKGTHFMPAKGSQETDSLSDEDVNMHRMRLKRSKIEKELDGYFMSHAFVGREYLVEVLMLALDVPKGEKVSMTHLYEKIAPIYGLEPSVFDRGIRRLLRETFLNLSEEKTRHVHKLYGKGDPGTAPTTREFVLNIVNKIKQDDLF